MSSLRYPPLIVGPELRERRVALHLTQGEFAEKIGASTRSVQAWEAGQIPQPRYRRALAEFFADPDEEEAA